MTKCISEALDTLLANHLRRFRCVETEKIGEGKTDISYVLFFYLSQHVICKNANSMIPQQRKLPSRFR